MTSSRVQLATLPGKLLLDPQDIIAVCEDLGISAEGITGAVVEIEDGEYKSVWLTDYASPARLDARYFEVPLPWRQPVQP